MLLFDAKPPKDATRPGGNAESFDWTLLQGVAFRVPWLLAGGLDAANVAGALRITKAPMVDVSSGVEDENGRKCSRKIREFISAVNVG
jgi:phosphoribosylanthranilate isomerase